MGAQVRTRRQQGMTLTAFGTKYVTTLGKGTIYREIILRLTGTFTYAAGANNAAATLGRGDEWSVIARVDLVCNGTDVVRSFSGTQLRMLQRMFYGAVPQVSVSMGDGASAAPSFDSTTIIPLWQPLAVKPMDTGLDTRKLSDFRIEVTTDTSANINTANGPTAINCSLEIASNECFGVTGDFSDCRMYPIVANIAGATQNYQIALPVTCVYRGFFLNCANGSANDSTDNNFITKVQLVSGTTIFRDMSFNMLRDWQRQRLGWNRELVQSAVNSGVISSVATNMQIAKSNLLNESCWTFFDLCQDGYLGEGVDSYGFSELYLNIDVSAACTVTAIPVQIFPNRNQTAAA